MYRKNLILTLMMINELQTFKIARNLKIINKHIPKIFKSPYLIGTDTEIHFYSLR